MKKIMTVAFLILLIAVNSACHRENDQEKIKNIIYGVEKGVEEKNIRGVTNHVAKEYLDPQGNNFAAIRGLLLGYFFRYPKISGYITHLNISVDGVSARVFLKAILTSGQKTGSVSDVVPEQLGMYRFDVFFKKESGDWKIISAQWSQADLQN